MNQSDAHMQGRAALVGTDEKVVPSAKFSPERRKQMIEEGWDLAAFDAWMMDEEQPEEDEELKGVPNEIFVDGYSVAATHAFFGYLVEIWIHNTGRPPGRSLMRPRYAQQLADLITQASRRKGLLAKSGLVTTDFEETIRVSPRSRGSVVITLNGTQATFSKRAAELLASKLREAAISHQADRTIAEAE